jgi:hypothetical protein
VTYLIVKALVSGLIVALASEAARRWPALGALLLSLPLVSLLSFVWLWRDTREPSRIADVSQSTFWFLLPSMPMFLVLPALLRSGWAFWPSLGLALALTVFLYLLMFWASPRLGIRL